MTGTAENTLKLGQPNIIVCIYVHIYVYIIICIYTYIYIHTHTHTHIYIYVFVYICMLSHICKYCVFIVNICVVYVVCNH